VRLKNGAMYRGKISEIVPGDHVKISLPTGETLTFPMSQVDYAGLAKLMPSAMSQPGPAPSQPRQQPSAGTPGAPVPAQSVSLSDVVVLKDGSLFRGTITELVAGERVTILLPSRETKTFSTSRVAYAGPAADMPSALWRPPASHEAPPSPEPPLAPEPRHHYHFRHRATYYGHGFVLRGSVGFTYVSDSEQADGSSKSANIYGPAFDTMLSLGGLWRNGLSVGVLSDIAIVPGPSVSFSGKTISSDSSVNLDFLRFGPYVDYYVSRSSGFHLMGELGFGLLVATANSNNSTAAKGFLVGAGVGYDWWIHHRWALGILARIEYAHMGISPAKGASGSDNTVAPTISFAVTL
jgi:hypothetical protein